ncbi:DMT family transporter [Cupriavidus plantarum]|uniref:Drug/metabolite transporter (DMT)-like permease n=1 Tax=Cupriavidus plantarum TaxID=942865 RepID=A0A316EWN3_9BURK|nr:DMT family transporter [Cupriavidus plantarum]NYH99031.1 drug/metabolite transporter (DMT)-like permease [Cupriavidus plantarum]PWK36255.1 drug/metabolite transporter (DMT)-like permease [Cupriavidus plantarum]REF02992.1 drug/metabolite transporter (DMT)-like permease [Cupriavidus plantarum]RLK44143.1 drug/metabolite transporter (DMT)-like permease [Cupriavidus plantarum]
MTLDRRGLILLVILTLAWGINWPVMKIGVAHFPALGFRLLCMAGGVVALGVALRLRGDSLAVPRAAWGTVVKLAIPNMVVWHLLAICAVKMLSSGRAAILGYTMPIWAVVWGLLLFRERIALSAWIGIGCALVGTILLLSGEIAAITGSPTGTLLMLGAAAGWGFGTQLMKRTQIDVPIGALTFWMLVVALPFLLLGSLLLESGWRMPNGIEWAAIGYNAVVVFAYCHLVWFALARSLPPVVSSLSIMFIPVVGVFSGMLLLGERPHWQDYAAIVLMFAALSSVMLGPSLRRRH